MATATTPAATGGTRPRDGITAALGAWLMIGLFVDGYVHNTAAGGELESFFTPWHALLYSGFAASAAWIALPMRHTAGPIRRRLAELPRGYAAGVVGVVVFAVGGLADSIWHSLLGIEVDLEALLSPPHLVLFAGAMLIVSTPARAAWYRPERAPGLRAFLPALASVTLSTLLVGFFLMYSSGMFDFHASARFAAVFDPGGTLAETPAFIHEVLSGFGVTARLLTTVVLMVPVILLVRRWTTPPGTFTILFTSYAAFMLVLVDFRTPALALAGPVAGIAADVLAARLRPSDDRPWALRTFAAVVPAVLWLAHFGLLAAGGDLGWTFELWGGVVLFGAGAGYTLSLLAAPPSAPPTPDGAG